MCSTCNERDAPFVIDGKNYCTKCMDKILDIHFEKKTKKDDKINKVLHIQQKAKMICSNG